MLVAVNDQKVDQILGTGTRQSNPDTNYESTLSSEAKIETRGTGTAPNHVGYFGFDFGSHAVCFFIHLEPSLLTTRHPADPFAFLRLWYSSPLHQLQRRL